MPLPVLRPLIYTLQALMALVINGRFGRLCGSLDYVE